MKTIVEFKCKWPGGKAMIVGAGPSSASLREAIEFEKPDLMIAINRAICLGTFDFVFVDHTKTLNEIRPFEENTKHFCLPVYSREELNLEAPVIGRGTFFEKTVYFAWGYECEWIFTAPAYSLNDFLLYISWGCAQSAAHFAHRCGASDIVMLGCDGTGDGYSKEIAKRFGLPSSECSKKRSAEHAKTKAGLLRMKELGIPIRFY